MPEWETHLRLIVLFKTENNSSTMWLVVRIRAMLSWCSSQLGTQSIDYRIDYNVLATKIFPVKCPICV